MVFWQNKKKDGLTQNNPPPHPPPPPPENQMVRPLAVKLKHTLASSSNIG